MANREELAIIRHARAGQASAQLELGRRYLFGSSSLPQSLPTALHWLERAARQECAAAWRLIGDHIPLALARDAGGALTPWYERAYDDGSIHAGLVFAQLVLAQPSGGAQRGKALQALAQAAQAGFADARGLLARHAQPMVPAAAGPARAVPPSGATGQQYPGCDEAWSGDQWQHFLALALPEARTLVRTHGGATGARRLTPDETVLLSRCARLLDPALATGEVRLAVALAPQEPGVFWELAATENDRYAQLALGLAQARMRIDGERLGQAGGVANFKKAIRWLTQAGEQGLAEAWYALSRIYIKPEFSQRNLADAQRYLERAAQMGYREAQLECGQMAWRARRECEGNDVRAVYWLQKAKAQGSSEAAALLARIAPRPATPAHTATGRLLATHGQALAAYPLLAARVELAALFNLTRAEALLLDVRAADHGHCLVVDIRASYGRSRRRLVMIDTAQERQAVTRIGALFESYAGCSVSPEGNYRQRLYRLRTLTSASGGNDGDGDDEDLAA